MSGPRRSPPDRSVLVIDDHELFASSLAQSLSRLGQPARLADVSTESAIIRSAATTEPSLAVLDLYLGRDQCTGDWINPVRLCEQLTAKSWQVLVVSGVGDEELEAATIVAGAVGTLPKTSAFEELLATIRLAAAGQPVMDDAQHREWRRRHLAFQAERRDAERRLDRLTSREHDVLTLLARGQRAAQIAETLVVSIPTVRTRTRAILAKLDCESQLEAAAFAHRWDRQDGPRPPLRD
jgi:DNA-binding NarL/FixJ family response regulator